MTQILALFSLCLLVVTIQSAPQDVIIKIMTEPRAVGPPATTTALVCSGNTTVSRALEHRDCFANCENRNDENRICPESAFIGERCLCKEGFIFKASTGPDCIKAEDC